MTDDVIDLQPHRARRAKVNLAAYADAAMHTVCPNCGAAPNQWCTRADGAVRRIPCVKRIRPSVGVAEFAGRGAAPLYVTKSSQEGNTP